MKCIGSSAEEIWSFAYLGAYGTPFRGKRRSYRGSAMAPFERAMVVIYRLSTVTVALCLTIRPQSTGGGSIWAKISGCFPWSRPMMFGSAESEHPRLSNGEIISEEFQPMWSQSTNVTDGRTDRQTDDMRSQDRALKWTKLHRAVKIG